MADGVSALNSNTIRIGIPGTQILTSIAGIYGNSGLESDAMEAFVDSNGNLGTGFVAGDPARDDIHAINHSSEALYSLRPVSFRRKTDFNAARRFGLLADEVEKVSPELVAHDKNGQPTAVRYGQVNAMLLNEFLKEHAQVQSQAAEITALQAAVVEQSALLRAVSKRLDAEAGQ